MKKVQTVATEQVAFDHIKSLLLCPGPLVERDNGTFVQPLQGGSLRFLHKIFAGCSDAQIVELRQISALALPDDYIAFMQWAGGAVLFDNTLFIYGLSNNWKKSLALEDQAPLSLPDKLSRLERMGRWEEVAKWQPVGSIAAATQIISIDISARGRARLVLEDGTSREFDSFADCLLSLVIVLVSATDDNGLKDSTKIEIEQSVLGLLTRH